MHNSFSPSLWIDSRRTFSRPICKERQTHELRQYYPSNLTLDVQLVLTSETDPSLFRPRDETSCQALDIAGAVEKSTVSMINVAA